MIVIRDVIESIVNSIKSTGIVTGISKTATHTTILTNDILNLQVGFKVVLKYTDSTKNQDAIIDSIGFNSFTIASTTFDQPNTWELALYFDSGHRIELHKKYTNKAKSINKKIQEYPLIWLYSDITRKKTDNEAAEFATDLSGAIVDFSELELYEDARIYNKFKPVLYPLYDLFTTAFNLSPNKRNFSGLEPIEFESTDRPFFGSSDKNKNVLPQITDAIEWSVELNWFKENCQ